MKRSVMLLALALAVAALAVLAGCGKKEYKPVAINPGVDKCEVCQMLIQDDQNATEIILTDGKPLKFDDIGDMYVWLKKNGSGAVGAKFVRDYNSKEWVELEKATFVYDKSNKTPMAFGVYSFKNEQDADKFIKEKGVGKKMTAKDLDSHSWERDTDMMKGGHGTGGGMQMQQQQQGQSGGGNMQMQHGQTGGMSK